MQAVLLQAAIAMREAALRQWALLGQQGQAALRSYVLDRLLRYAATACSNCHQQASCCEMHASSWHVRMWESDTRMTVAKCMHVHHDRMYAYMYAPLELLACMLSR